MLFFQVRSPFVLDTGEPSESGDVAETDGLVARIPPGSSTLNCGVLTRTFKKSGSLGPLSLPALSGRGDQARANARQASMYHAPVHLPDA